MRRLGSTPLVCLIVVAVLLLAGHPLWAQADSTTTTDKTGIFGAVIDHYFGAIVALIQSLLVYLLGKASPQWAKVPEIAKWAVLYFVGVALTWISLKTGFGGATIEGNALTTAMVVGSVPTLASGLVFKLGGHSVKAQQA